jgi:sugar transferase EpsL
MIKRAFDVVGATLLLLLFAPLMALVGLCARVLLGGPVLFRQERPGRYGRPFELLKFRTMTNARDEGGALLPDAMRVTRFGLWLRKTSLDELPELLNVVMGEMSLVGPRPLLTEYLPLYSPEQARRHEARPGMTGWAQVNGRNAVSWEEKFRLDVWYVDHQSLWLDVRILLLTLVKVFRAEGISATGYATMPKFTGCSRIDKSESG